MDEEPIEEKPQTRLELLALKLLCNLRKRSIGTWSGGASNKNLASHKRSALKLILKLCVIQRKEIKQ